MDTTAKVTQFTRSPMAIGADLNMKDVNMSMLTFIMQISIYMIIESANMVAVTIKRASIAVATTLRSDMDSMIPKNSRSMMDIRQIEE